MLSNMQILHTDYSPFGCYAFSVSWHVHTYTILTAMAFLFLYHEISFIFRLNSCLALLRVRIHRMLLITRRFTWLVYWYADVTAFAFIYFVAISLLSLPWKYDLDIVLRDLGTMLIYALFRKEKKSYLTLLDYKCTLFF